MTGSNERNGDFATVTRPRRICCMKLLCFLGLSVAGMFALSYAAVETSAQIPQSSQERALLSKLSPPIYPPLARAARVSGDVEVALRIRQDGSVESAEVVSGHPLLKAAAIDSARQSKFECHECREAVTPYSILYSFGFTTSQHCCEPQETSAATEQGAEPRAGITQSQNHVTILTEPLCICDPSADVIKVRSPKCLLLWHCGKRYGL
jgi:TonB family protein